MRGRKPKPTALKLIEGNRGKRRLNESEPKPPPGAPDCPEWLHPEAAMEWSRVVPALDLLGLLTKVDQVALAVYCQAWARYVEAEQAITSGGSVIEGRYGIRPSPYVSISNRAVATMRAYCTEFGLTPSSRGRMSIGGVRGGTECPRCELPLSLCGCR